SDYLWGRFLVERGLVDGEHYERENRRFYEQYSAGTLDIEAFAHFSFAPLAAHAPADLQGWRADFIREKIQPIVAAGAPALLAHHRARGDALLITTATNRFVTEPIAQLLGVEHLLATELEQRDGRFTGRLGARANFRDGKVSNLEAWLAQQAQHYQQISCYSDSHNDLPLLRFAQHAFAVDPDPVLRAEAERCGWPVISLRSTETV
ncbi:MAG: family hydrolase, partial [Nevskia sp.]|nr:family hydrolase [Nevskia sp.]